MKSFAHLTREHAAWLARRRRRDAVFVVAAALATSIGLLVLAALVIDVIHDGAGRLSWAFLTSFPSRRPAQAGILSALVGSCWLLVLTALIAFPIGVATAVYLEEYDTTETWFRRLIEVNIANLAGVPSIIYGLLGLGIFVRVLEPITGGRSVLAGALTMALLVMPIVIIAAREALKAVPDGLRQAGYALGATRWQVVSRIVLPSAVSGILTGTILALARAVGETAPLVTMGALTYVAFLPELSLEGLRAPFTVLPIQIFNWISRPQPEFHQNAAAGTIVLLALLLAMNALAIVLRLRLQRQRES
ncbi:MAG TPA: phosphate ABC transporter permease PstA [Candidatus Limnocylindria bacterium]|nr:phosphate ABC transporter permease PstA [Candidatus Limnocylindria bacterium]